MLFAERMCNLKTAYRIDERDPSALQLQKATPIPHFDWIPKNRSHRWMVSTEIVSRRSLHEAFLDPDRLALHVAEGCASLAY